MKRHILALSVCAILVTIAAGGLGTVFAQGVPAQLLVTWQAGTYVPPGFTGKVMPVSDSSILVGVDLINLGKRVDLSPYTIYWYVNEDFYQGATGLTRISLTAPHFIGENTITIRVLVKDYGAGLGKTITIPVATPEAVIQSSAPNLSAAATPFSLWARPYFFNVQDPSRLSFNWSLNGQSVGSQNPLMVTKEMSENRRNAQIEVSVINPARIIERASEKLFIFRQTP